MITEKRAMLVFPSQSGPSTPIFARSALKRPREGCIRELKVRPTAMVLTRLGKNKTERMMCFVFMGEVRRTASPIPNTTLKPQVSTAYNRVFCTPMRRLYSEKKVLKLYRPTKRNSVKVQMVILKKNEMIVGKIKITA
jgi:hypothetical protein